MRFEVYQQASGNRHEPNYSDDSSKIFSLNDIDEIIEKMSEQKLADKAEPKFHEGEWVVDEDDNRIHQIKRVLENVTSGKYAYDLIDDGYFPSTKNNYHLWTIQDAKDGDVLACNEEILLFKSYSVQGRISLYCWYNGQTNNIHSKGVDDASLTTRNKICPATKEQRNLLLQKMKEAGYEFDAEKKELKKTEESENIKNQIMSEITDLVTDYIQQKPAKWSEEDMFKIQRICKYLNESKKYYGDITEVKECINWLKSLKDRVQPKQE